jgi:hypothetical protein
MMNILPRNPADREAKSPCDKNIRYPVCVTWFTEWDYFFWQLWYMINRKPPSWMIQVTWSTLVDCLRAGLFLARSQSTYFPVYDSYWKWIQLKSKLLFLWGTDLPKKTTHLSWAGWLKPGTLPAYDHKNNCWLSSTRACKIRSKPSKNASTCYFEVQL